MAAIKSAACITCGEQSENHAGMVKYGDGLAENGFTCEKLKELSAKYKGVSELVDLSTEGGDEACVLILRGGVDYFTGGLSGEMWENELKKLEWDRKYFDTRRQKVLNKIARANVCFGEVGGAADFEKGVGTVVEYSRVPILNEWKKAIENFVGCGNCEAEGNFYYDAKKCGIGFHGDGERKRVIAASLADEGVKRKIVWNWFLNGKPVGNTFEVFLESGDCYIMSEKASGWDWKKRKILTLRHAAAVEGSKYLKLPTPKVSSGTISEEKKTCTTHMTEPSLLTIEDSVETIEDAVETIEDAVETVEVSSSVEN